MELYWGAWGQGPARGMKESPEQSSQVHGGGAEAQEHMGIWTARRSHRTPHRAESVIDREGSVGGDRGTVGAELWGGLGLRARLARC